MQAAVCSWCGKLFETSDEYANEPPPWYPPPRWYKPCRRCAPEAKAAEGHYRERLAFYRRRLEVELDRRENPSTLHQRER